MVATKPIRHAAAAGARADAGAESRSALVGAQDARVFRARAGGLRAHVCQGGLAPRKASAAPAVYADTA